MKLNQPYYIEPRGGKVHIDLNGEWDFFWSDDVKETIADSDWSHRATLPASLYHMLHKSGILPDPYFGTNSKQYHWVDEKIWYYRKKFTLNAANFCGNAFLCFDGVAYYCRVWINGVLLGDHEGMFGGPCVDIAEYLNLNSENELIVEVKAFNIGVKDSFDMWNAKGENSQIVPWNVTRDTYTSNGDFMVAGIWNNVRLELVNKLHLSRPQLFTKSIEDNKATLHFEVEIADGRIEELHEFYGRTDNNDRYNRAFDNGITGATLEEQVEIKVTISDGEDIVYESTDLENLTDFDRLLMTTDYHELQFFTKDIVIENPKLWWPNGMGEPFLYNVELTLSFDGEVCDKHTFKTGIRTFTSDFTKGNKYRTEWEKFLFSINGKPFFLKGINWTPIDFLFDISSDEYDWCLALAKNAGIQLLRVWNGGGMPETDHFYKRCDELGIMVWQDHMITNTISTKNFPQTILESQIAYNIYRIRNHPSLVLNCGGNEFNPYTEGNAASMFITDRTVRQLDPSRIFHYTTADKGSAHIYRDIEPVWYRHIYKQLPFLAESGIHSFPSYRSLKKLLDENETTGPMPDLTTREFPDNYPGIINHFIEYMPERIPQMLSRISQIDDISTFTLKDYCEASQVQAFEFYQLMVQSMQENFPVCGGVMPWVFKRPWTTVGVQTVDGSGQPGYPYYAIQNSYRPLNIYLCQEWSVIAPNEPVPLKVKIFNQNNEDIADSELTVTVYTTDMTVEMQETLSFEGLKEYDFGTFIPNASHTNSCFIISTDLNKNGLLLARSVYFIKCTDMLNDEALYNKYRSGAVENLSLTNGPWLKAVITNAKKATLTAAITKRGIIDSYHYADVLIENISDISAFPVTVEPKDESARFYLSDNFFLLKAGESKTVRITSDTNGLEKITVNLWNGKAVSAE